MSFLSLLALECLVFVLKSWLMSRFSWFLSSSFFLFFSNRNRSLSINPLWIIFFCWTGNWTTNSSHWNQGMYYNVESHNISISLSIFNSVLRMVISENFSSRIWFLFLHCILQVVDLLAPYQRGGKISLFGGAGVGQTILIMQLINNVAEAHG